MIFRVEKTKNYTVMSNFHLREKEMSLKAKGLLSWMLSNTDDWDYSIEGIVANCKENRTAIKTALQELIKFGYLEIKKLMPESYTDEEGNKVVVRGRIEYEYIVHEEAIENPSVDVEIQDAENVCVENHTQRSTKASNTNKQNKNSSKEELHTQDFQFGYKKQRAKKENLYSKCISLIDSYTIDTELRTALVDYLRVRLEMKDKPIYLGMWKGLLNKLDREFDASERLNVVRQSIERGYASFFPVNKGYSKSYDIRKDKPWEKGVTSETYTEEEKREIDRQTAEREARGEQVWY